MAYSAATYKGDGSQSTFIIPFDYLQKDFVKVTINEVDKVYAQDYNVDGRELSFPTAPPSGSIIKVYRETPTDRMVKWNEGSVLTSSNMTTQQIQELHLIEETTYNLKNSAMLKNEDNHKWEGQYLPITHVGDPTDDSDAINLGTIKKEETGFLASVRSQLDKWLANLGTTYNNYSKSLKESFDSYTSSLKNQFDTHTASLLKDFNNYKDTLKTNYDTYTSNLSTTFNGYKDTLLNKYNEYLTSLTATKDAVKDSEANTLNYKDEAKNFSDSAKESATQCSASVATCTTRVTEANQAKESASASANTATTKATESGNSASLAKQWAVSADSPDGAVGSKSAKTWTEEAKASEDNAKVSENNAKASESASANSANASATSASAARDSENNAKVSENNAKASEVNAKASEVNAKASEVAAAESANQAATGQINADWNETNVASKAFIKNKPDVPTRADVANSVTTNTLTVSGESFVPTANEGNSSSTIASTEFVAKSLAKMVDSAPESLNTLNELAKALGNDPNFATTVINELGKKMDSAEAESTYAKKEDTGVLSGTVMAFSGTFENGYPLNKRTGLADKKWHLCDGMNGTPDLRNRFIYGGDGTNGGATGGEANVTLTEENIPVHSHTASVSSAGNHYHLMTRNIDLTVTNPNGINPSWDTVNDFDGSHTYKTSEAGDHTHTVTIGNTGGNQPHNNMPPYYVLAYIMKL